MKPVLYGIKNCDTMKKARTWLESHQIEYTFHDYRTSGIDRERLDKWIRMVGWEVLLNRAGTTFRRLPDARRQDVGEREAVALMLELPAMIKRPVLEHGTGLLVGFKPEEYASIK